MMTCAETTPRIDAFVDGELAPSESMDVARHLAQCVACDRAARRLLVLRDAVVTENQRAVDALDLSGLWTQVEGAIDRAAAQSEWRERAAARRGVPRRIVWGAIAAIAASAAIFFFPGRGPQPGFPSAQQVVKKDKRQPNHVYIDRLAGKDIALRREPKSGTTMIWVNHEVESRGW